MTNLFRVKRIAAGLSMGQLAVRLNISRQAVHLWETGQSWPAPRHIPQLADIFGLDRQEFAQATEEARAEAATVQTAAWSTPAQRGHPMPLSFSVSYVPACPGVYRLVNLFTGENYVGASADLRARAAGHSRALAGGKVKNKRLAESLRQYTAAAFRFRVLECCGCERELAGREEHWISRLRPALNTLTRNGRVVWSRRLRQQPAEA
jgi:transcriptional regulator with XRE-family HTH domain